MSLKRLTVCIILVEMIGLGVFCAFLIGATATVGGVATIDMTQYGERWIEYWMMLALTATVPYALWYVTGGETE